MKTKLHVLLSLSFPVCAASVLLSATATATPCLTMQEARSKWPSARLYWHTPNRCWDQHPKGADHYDPRPTMKMLPPRVPEDVAGAGEPQSGLERVTANAPAAEIFYPELIRGEILQAYPLLIWQQPWLTSVSIMEWPLLIDIDRAPFTSWDKRVGQ